MHCQVLGCLVRAHIRLATPAVELYLRGTQAVWVIGIVVALAVPALSRILRDLHPVVFTILDLPGILESLSKQLPEIVIIGRIFESQVSYVSKILRELLGESLAKILDSSGLLLLSDLLVLLLVCSSFQTLPGQSAAQEIHENMS